MSRIPNRAVALVVAPLVAVVLVATTCGSSDGDAGADDPSPAVTSSTTTSTVAEPTTTVPAFDPSAAGVEPAVAPAGEATDATIETADGRTRTYRTYVPSSVDASPGAEPVPLLLAFHGGGGWGAQFERNSGFDGLAEANGFLVVYPTGIGGGADGSGLRTWNGGACCGRAAAEQVDDVAFVDQLLDELEATHPIDPARIYAAGHSNGGILSYRLACELSDRIVAIGVQSGALEIDGCRPTTPVSALHVHGSADDNLPITGGEGPSSIAGVDFTVPIDGAATLAAADDCGPTPTEPAPTGRTDLTVTTWTGCEDDAEVTFVEVADASHAWMGSTVGGSGQGGAPYPDLDTSLQIWAFLSAHPRP